MGSCLIARGVFSSLRDCVACGGARGVLRKDDANIRGKAFGTPGDGGVASFGALSMGGLLGNIFGIFIRTRSFFEP